MSRTNKLHFIEAMLNWFASPSMGRELDVKFLSDTYDEITAPAWVSVEEELPKETGWYLVATPTLNSKIDVALWDGKWFRLITITHWMPLPQSPVKGGEQ